MADSKYLECRISTGIRVSHWMRLSVVAAALACAASPTLAASKASLTGFNGIAFGTKFAVAKQRLGAKATAKKSPSAPKTNILLQSDIALYGETMVANYTFGTDDRLKIIYALIKTPKKDPAVCKSQWQNVVASLRRAYGAPDAQGLFDAKWPQSADVSYVFANGAKLDATLLGCLMMLVHTAPGYHKQ